MLKGIGHIPYRPEGIERSGSRRWCRHVACVARAIQKRRSRNACYGCKTVQLPSLSGEMLEISECGPIERFAMVAQMMVTVQIPQEADDDDVVVGFSIRRHAIEAEDGVWPGVVCREREFPVAELVIVRPQHTCPGENILSGIPRSVQYLHQSSSVRSTKSQRVSSGLHRHHRRQQSRTNAVALGSGNDQEGPTTHAPGDARAKTKACALFELLR
jgi:hypothetical protein